MTHIFAADHVHVIGCGGAGMSGLVRLLHESGVHVSGCNQVMTDEVRSLRDSGVEIFEGHDPSHVTACSLVTASPSVVPELPELVGAELAWSRADVFAAVSAERVTTAIAGTHGKTTATSMAVCVWERARREASWLLGAPVRGVGQNGHGASGPELILECDESFGTFARTTPARVGILNVEADHLDFYGNYEAVEDAFVSLADRSGECVVWVDDAGAGRVAARTSSPVITVGRESGEWRVTREEVDIDGASFILSGPDCELLISLTVTGSHNVSNAAVVAVVALRNGISTGDVIRGLSDFRGAPRRFEWLGERDGTAVIDDYAHLPSEVRASIAAVRELGAVSVAVLFQPHRVTRSVALADEFADAFDGATTVVIGDIYDAGEPNPDGVTGELIADAVRARVDSPATHYAATRSDMLEWALRLCDDHDALLVMGAGDVGEIARQVTETP